MLRLTSRIALSAALSAALLLPAATSAPAGATPIVNGHGQWATPVGTIGFQVSVVALPDGTLQGSGISTNHNETGVHWFHFEVLEYARSGDDVIVMGLIDQAFNAPGFLGTKTVLVIRDDGQGTASQDRALSASGLPTWVTLDLLLNAPPPMVIPPPQFWFPLQSGNFEIH